MKNKIFMIVGVLVVGLFTLFIGSNKPASAPVEEPTNLEVQASGNVTQQIDQYTNGLTVGNQTFGFIQGKIGPGRNQGVWRNTTGTTVLVDLANIGWLTGTASSSWYFYAGTSTASSVSDYARPSNGILLIDSALTATSTGPVFVTSTTTSSGIGQGSLIVPQNGYVFFSIQERYGCKTTGGLCETATSTNRGVSNFNYSFRYRMVTQ